MLKYHTHISLIYSDAYVGIPDVVTMPNRLISRVAITRVCCASSKKKVGVIHRSDLSSSPFLPDLTFAASANTEIDFTVGGWCVSAMKPRTQQHIAG